MIDITLAEQLKKDGYVLTMSVGASMKPMLTQRREQLVIEKLETAPKNNDVVLFQRQSGKYVLHRVVRTKKDHYLIRGDNCCDNEKVYPQQIIGILKGFYRGERYISCRESRKHRCYIAIWRLLYPVRWGYCKGKVCAYRLISRLRR